jgi:hypothetical protein
MVLVVVVVVLINTVIIMHGGEIGTMRLARKAQ